MFAASQALDIRTVVEYRGLREFLEITSELEYQRLVNVIPMDAETKILRSRLNGAIIRDYGELGGRGHYEEPQFFEGGRGIVTARGGSLVKLCLLAGMIAGRLSVTMHTVRLVPVRDWKGSCPKDVMEPRILRKLKGWNPVTGTTHELDAVGLGMYIRGAL